MFLCVSILPSADNNVETPTPPATITDRHTITHLASVVCQAQFWAYRLWLFMMPLSRLHKTNINKQSNQSPSCGGKWTQPAATINDWTANSQIARKIKWHTISQMHTKWTKLNMNPKCAPHDTFFSCFLLLYWVCQYTHSNVFLSMRQVSNVCCSSMYKNYCMFYHITAHRKLSLSAHTHTSHIALASRICQLLWNQLARIK